MQARLITLLGIGALATMTLPGVLNGPEDLRDSASRVRPGLVEWHSSHEAALEASSISGKPVLLFQLLGRLDEEFC